MLSENVYTIDATGKPLGRLAVEVALILRGKNKADYLPNKAGESKVVVQNISKIKVTGKKMKDKVYSWHSGHPGGFKQATMAEVVEKKGFQEIFRRAVLGMLPKNKLRKIMIKNLIFK